MYDLTLADIARSTGLPVVEHSGWRTRGHGGLSGIAGVVCHHTGAEGGAWLDVVINGREDLPGPLCNYAVGLDGTVHVVAAGLAYHAGVVNDDRWSNGHALGIEAENYGTRLPWPTAQYGAYVRLVAAIIGHHGLPVAAVKGHKEVAAPLGRKDDPNFDMGSFRGAVAAQLIAPANTGPSEDDMPFSCTTYQLPPRFAFTADQQELDTTAVLTLGTPLGGLTGLTAGWISASADLSAVDAAGHFVPSTVRVACATRTSDGHAAWSVQLLHLDSGTSRQVVQLPTGCDKVSVGRMDTAKGAGETTPIGITLELK